MLTESWIFSGGIEGSSGGLEPMSGGLKPLSSQMFDTLKHLTNDTLLHLSDRTTSPQRHVIKPLLHPRPDERTQRQGHLQLASRKFSDLFIRKILGFILYFNFLSYLILVLYCYIFVLL